MFVSCHYCTTQVWTFTAAWDRFTQKAFYLVQLLSHCWINNQTRVTDTPHLPHCCLFTCSSFTWMSIYSLALRTKFEYLSGVVCYWNACFTSTQLFYGKVTLVIDNNPHYDELFPLQPEDHIHDDFLFPMSNRLSYASSPESDLDNRPGYDDDDDEMSPVVPRRKLIRSSSDPSIATNENVPGIPPYPNPPNYRRDRDGKPVSPVSPASGWTPSALFVLLLPPSVPTLQQKRNGNLSFIYFGRKSDNLSPWVISTIWFDIKGLFQWRILCIWMIFFQEHFHFFSKLVGNVASIIIICPDPLPYRLWIYDRLWFI